MNLDRAVEMKLTPKVSNPSAVNENKRLIYLDYSFFFLFFFFWFLVFGFFLLSAVFLSIFFLIVSITTDA